MQDPRLKFFTIGLLSASAFLSVPAAIGTLIWWYLFTPGIRGLRYPKMMLAVLGMIAAAAAVSEATGGPGLSYLVRMTAILLIAAWAYADRREGEFLDLAVWLFGDRLGFDLGLIGEMSLQSLDVIRRDIAHMQTALFLKGKKPGLRTIVPLAVNLIVLQFRRTDDQARLLAARGYTKGGHLCPKFQADRRDALSTAFAVVFVLSAWLILRDVFIVAQ